MRIHLIRHGDANPHGRPTWATDDERPLSRKGRQESRRAGQALLALGAEPDLVLTSPLARARQTAEEVCTALGSSLEPVQTAVLRPGASAGPLVEEIAARHPESKEILCAGHMPDLGYIAARLVTGSAASPFRLETGSLVRIDLEAGEARLVWMLPPRVLRDLAAPE
jgi:phosphohistidine phosphatase